LYAAVVEVRGPSYEPFPSLELRRVSQEAFLRSRLIWVKSVLGYREQGDEDLLDPTPTGRRSGSRKWTHRAPQRNRIHVDS
ncbi:MAG: hypothetical protein LC739_06345, partial [Actinobacteria bacterium]|nr:hypothetical protein [Actinomycetota bacterium]